MSYYTPPADTCMGWFLARKSRQIKWRSSQQLSEKRGDAKSQQISEKATGIKFVSLLAGNATLHDWAWILKYREKRALLNQFCLSTKSLNPAEDVLWPVVWYLTRYSRKNIYLTSSLPSTARMEEALRNLEARIAWRWTLRKKANSMNIFSKFKKTEVLLARR